MSEMRFEDPRPDNLERLVQVASYDRGVYRPPTRGYAMLGNEMGIDTFVEQLEGRTRVSYAIEETAVPGPAYGGVSYGGEHKPAQRRPRELQSMTVRGMFARSDLRLGRSDRILGFFERMGVSTCADLLAVGEMQVCTWGEDLRLRDNLRANPFGKVGVRRLRAMIWRGTGHAWSRERVPPAALGQCYEDIMLASPAVALPLPRYLQGERWGSVPFAWYPDLQLMGRVTIGQMLSNDQPEIFSGHNRAEDFAWFRRVILSRVVEPFTAAQPVK